MSSRYYDNSRGRSPPAQHDFRRRRDEDFSRRQQQQQSPPMRRPRRDRSNDTSLTARDKHVRARREGFIGSPSYEPIVPLPGQESRPGFRGGRGHRPAFLNGGGGGGNRHQRANGNNDRGYISAGGDRRRSNQSLTPPTEHGESSGDERGGRGGGDKKGGGRDAEAGGDRSSPAAARQQRQRRARRSHTPVTRRGSSGGGDGASRSTSNRRRERERPRMLSDSKLKRDDEDHLEYASGDIILGRYQLLRTLGKGTFGKVAEMCDINDRAQNKLALKIIRDVDKYRRAAEAEINFLEFISKCRAQPGKNLCVIMHSYFNYHGHMCIIFEKLGISVYDFMKRNDYHPYGMAQTRHIAYQLCHAVRFLHNNRITHTDLKPENMLFTYTDYRKERAWAPQYEGKEIRVMSHANIRIIDFGSAIFDQEPHTSTVTTRHYRAPEVVLKLGWSKPCDVWSIACIIFELYTGITMFQTHEDREHLAMMEHILGRLPLRMLKKTKTDHYILPTESSNSFKLDWDPACSGARYIDEHCKSLEAYFKTPYNGDPQEARALYELLREMFEYDPDRRMDLDHIVRRGYFDRLPRDLRIPLGFSSSQQQDEQQPPMRNRYNSTMRDLHEQRGRHGGGGGGMGNGDSGFRSLSSKDYADRRGGGGRRSSSAQPQSPPQYSDRNRHQQQQQSIYGPPRVHIPTLRTPSERHRSPRGGMPPPPPLRNDDFHHRDADNNNFTIDSRTRRRIENDGIKRLSPSSRYDTTTTTMLSPSKRRRNDDVVDAGGESGGGGIDGDWRRQRPLRGLSPRRPRDLVAHKYSNNDDSGSRYAGRSPSPSPFPRAPQALAAMASGHAAGDGINRLGKTPTDNRSSNRYDQQTEFRFNPKPTGERRGGGGSPPPPVAAASSSSRRATKRSASPAAFPPPPPKALLEKLRNNNNNNSSATKKGDKEEGSSSKRVRRRRSSQQQHSSESGGGGGGGGDGSVGSHQEQTGGIGSTVVHVNRYGERFALVGDQRRKKPPLDDNNNSGASRVGSNDIVAAAEPAALAVKVSAGGGIPRPPPNISTLLARGIRGASAGGARGPPRHVVDGSGGDNDAMAVARQYARAKQQQQLQQADSNNVSRNISRMPPASPKQIVAVGSSRRKTARRNSEGLDGQRTNRSLERAGSFSRPSTSNRNRRDNSDYDDEGGERHQFVRSRNQSKSPPPAAVAAVGTGDVFAPPPKALTRRVREIAVATGVDPDALAAARPGKQARVKPAAKTTEFLAEVVASRRSHHGASDAAAAAPNQQKSSSSVVKKRHPHRAGRRIQAKKARDAEAAVGPTTTTTGTKRRRSNAATDQEEEGEEGEVENENAGDDSFSPPPAAPRMSSQVFIRREVSEEPQNFPIAANNIVSASASASKKPQRVVTITKKQQRGGSQERVDRHGGGGAENDDSTGSVVRRRRQQDDDDEEEEEDGEDAEERRRQRIFKRLR